MKEVLNIVDGTAEVQPDEVDEVLRIQYSRSLSRMLEMKLTKDDIEKNGFLIHLLSREEFQELLKNERVKIFVHHGAESIDGYLLIYDLKYWMELNPDWANNIDFINKNDKEELNEPGIYLRHVATSKDSKSGLGYKLSSKLIDTSRDSGFLNIYGEILESPYKNSVSIRVHTHLGFEKVGTINEDNGSTNYVWGLYRVKLKK